MALRLLLPFALLPLLACEGDLPKATEADQAVEYRFADLSITRQNLAEVRVRLANPTRRITTERYASCIVSDAAQAKGFVWVKRLRGKRRIDGPIEDLAVRYTLHRLDEPEGDTVFTAALTLSLCKVDGIPTVSQAAAPDENLPELSLGGSGAPVEGPGAVAPVEELPAEVSTPLDTSLPIDPVSPDLPPFDPPPVDPEEGI